MTAIDITQLTDEQKKALQKQLKEEEKAEKDRIAQEKKISKGLKDTLVLENVDFLIDTRNGVEEKVVKMLSDVETILKIEAKLYKSKSEDQDSFSHTLDDGTANIKIGWNVKPTFNGTEIHGIIKLKEFMTSLVGDSENEKLLMEILNIALKTDDKGNYNPQKVRGLDKLREKAKSDLFNEAMDIINEATIDIRTSRFVRGYKMVDFGDGNIKRVNFNFSID